MTIMMIVSAVFIILAVILTFIRFLIGPTVYDRIAALDVLTLITTVIIVILSVNYKQKIFMDAAIVYSLLSFIGVIAFARFMEKKNDQ